ncbi:hypothetical protein B0H10DRAFT_1952853 [Mycena sp. CBHHK59/15]|nr:hypothetical protein B0H10DRAFT_1952853 [Mycena sp. CBHHK59/15]
MYDLVAGGGREAELTGGSGLETGGGNSMKVFRWVNGMHQRGLACGFGSAPNLSMSTTTSGPNTVMPLHIGSLPRKLESGSKSTWKPSVWLSAVAPSKLNVLSFRGYDLKYTQEHIYNK